MFIVSSEDLAANRALLERVDRLETSPRASVSVATNERPPVSSASFSRSGTFGPSTSPYQAGRSCPGSIAWQGASYSSNRDCVQRHPQVPCQHGRLDGIEWLGTGRLVVTVGQENEYFLLRRSDQAVRRGLQRSHHRCWFHRRQPAPGVHSPRIRSRSSGRDRRACQLGIIGEHNQADQIVRPPLDKLL